jgi:CheY-like chemotaxis protein
VQRLLTFSRRQALRPESVDVGEKLHGMAELLRRTLGAAVVLEVAVSGEEVCAEVDPAQLESALLNLALNARDAMPGGGTLRLAAEAVRLRDDADLPDGPHVRLTVADTGTGIDPVILPQVFEPFFSTKAPGAGSGLGLSMVYGFVHQSGGLVRIDSTPGCGTRVEILLPAAAPAGVAAAPALQSRRAAPGVRGAQILVVEDEPSVRAVVCAALQQLGCEVEAVDDGDAALVRLGGSAQFDLVISDVVLPGSASGVDVVRRARALQPDRPCILMSGYAPEHLTADADDLRELPMLNKPFMLEELEAAVGKALKTRTRARPGRLGGRRE